MPTFRNSPTSLERSRSLRGGPAICAMAFLVAVAFPALLHAQTYSVLHTFVNAAGGQSPRAGLALDSAGNLYGTTMGGGSGGGTVFKLAGRNGGWILSPLHDFNFSTGDGVSPMARPLIASDGTLYGTTQNGASQTCEILGCGVVYNVRPASSICKVTLCYWTESLPWVFVATTGQGVNPVYGDLIFDQTGNILGTTVAGGTNSYGAVYMLTRSGGGWTETTLYSFTGGSDGTYPESGLTPDAVGNYYGTTVSGGGTGCQGQGCGTVYELSPNGGGWTEKVLYRFQNGQDGNLPVGGVTVDAAGNLFGTTASGGANGGGTVFELSPSNGGWTYTLLYAFPAPGTGQYAGPTGKLVLNADKLYGTTNSGGVYGFGSVFSLAPSNGTWSYTSLHDFDLDDGAGPFGSVVFDQAGNLYGTTSFGGNNGTGSGVIWEIAP